MKVRRVGWVAAVFVATVLWISCGEVYRPVVIPIANNPPNPANFHTVIGITNNVAPNPGTAMQIDVSGDSNIGQASMGINPTHAAILPNNFRIFVTSAGSILAGNPDVITSFSPNTGNSLGGGIGNTITFSLPNVGGNQSAAITAISESGNLVTATLASPGLPNASAGGPIVVTGVIIPGQNVPNPAGYDGNFTITSVSNGGTTIAYNDPITGLAPLSATSGTAMIPVPTFCSYQPDFVATTQTTAAYVANYGQENGATCSLASTDSIAALNTSSNAITQIEYLAAGSHPVLLAQTPNGQNLFVVNQGDGTSATNVLNLSTTDLSTTATIPIGINPSWIAMRADGQRVYVLTEGDGQLYTIRTADNSLASVQSVGVGAKYMLYDKNLNRLYVTAPATGTGANGLLYVYSATGDSPAALPTPSGNPAGALNIPPVPPCANATATCSPVTPISVAALPDGSRFYVASYQTQSPCSDPNAGTGSCLIPMLTVFDAKSLSIKPASSSYFGTELALLSSPPFAASSQSTPPQYAVPEVSSCAPAAIYTPSSTRFRMFATASADSSHVYVSICDAGAIASITTTTNTVSQGSNEEDRLVIDLMAPLGAGSVINAPQNPVFLLAGQ